MEQREKLSRLASLSVGTLQAEAIESLSWLEGASDEEIRRLFEEIKAFYPVVGATTGDLDPEDFSRDPVKVHQAAAIGHHFMALMEVAKIRRLQAEAGVPEVG